MAAKRVLCYLKSTRNCSFYYCAEGKPLFGYVDLDQAGDVSNRSSRRGYVFKIAGSAVSWDSRKQKCIAQSTTEAEYAALAEATRGAAYIEIFLLDAGLMLEKELPITLFCDNQGAGKLSRNRGAHSRTKHIDIKYHYVRKMYTDGLIKVDYIATIEMTEIF